MKSISSSRKKLRLKFLRLKRSRRTRLRKSRKRKNDTKDSLSYTKKQWSRERNELRELLIASIMLVDQHFLKRLTS